MPNAYYDVMTETFLCLYPHVFEPSKFEGEEGEGDYSLVMVFDNAEQIKALKEAARKALADKWPKGAPQGLRSPFRDGSEKAADWGDFMQGKIFVRAKTRRQPVVMDRSTRNLADKNAIYSGCYCKASVCPFVYDKAGNRGIGFRLNGVQLVRDGEAIGGQSAEAIRSQFKPVEDEALAFDPAGLDEI
jgi:hypothetical protein